MEEYGFVLLEMSLTEFGTVYNGVWSFCVLISIILIAKRESIVLSSPSLESSINENVSHSMMHLEIMCFYFTILH